MFFRADIDECAIGSDGCNSTVSQCENSNGSFDCTCRSGFNMSAEQVCVCKFLDFKETF
ncbi:MAG: hypothetical protein HFP76_00910 [Methylococcales symbiont of Iophon sp. n. MRB-2018]|nr:MAG: hypothetical protein HFP76_00910 [Methylococcales symbiont of Iophon sp. n. MRB-2018]